jgi:2-polyprenyl-3-methyl-5-hydroxy-6-metoxy-1,4-benzoquinol methylase
VKQIAGNPELSDTPLKRYADLHGKVANRVMEPPLIYAIQQHVMKEHVLKTFISSNLDDETKIFLQTYCSETESLVRSTMASITRKFMSRTDTNAYIGRGQMFVFSTQQLETLLLQAASVEKMKSYLTSGRLLDIGAGSGDVTQNYTKFVKHITATEVSTYMVGRLKKNAHIDKVVETSTLNVFDANNKFQIISCLNVLDRCDKPSQLLKDIRARLDLKNGLLIVALVLPWCPFVENGTKQDMPSEDLDMDGGRCKKRNTFEEAVNVVIDKVFLPHGFNVKSWTRL